MNKIYYFCTFTNPKQSSMKKLFYFLFIASVSVSFSCNRVKKTAKDTINKGGETVGKGASEFIKGVSDGVGKSLTVKLELSEELKNKGLRTGKYFVASQGGTENKLSVYFIFDGDFADTLKAKAYGEDGLELGRTKLFVNGRSEDAAYFDFVFDKRTNIDSEGVIKIE